MSKAVERLVLVLIGALAIYLLMFNLDGSIHPGDESIHAKVAQEMSISADYFSPTFWHSTYLNKPPFKIWLSIVPITIFSGTNFSYRLIDSLSGLLTLLVTWRLGQRLFNNCLISTSAVFLLLTTREFLFDHGARVAVQDSFLTLVSTSACYVGWRALSVSERGQLSIRSKVSIGILTGFGLLTKWIAGLYPLMVLGVAHLTAYRRPLRTIMAYGPAALVAMLMASLYIVPVYLAKPELFLDMLDFNLNRRLITEGFHNTSRPWFYLNMLFWRSREFPPLLLVGSLLTMVCRGHNLRSSLNFLLIWALLPLILFSLFRSRLEWYILPSFPAYALICGYGVNELVQSVSKYRSSKRTLIPLLALCVMILVGFQFVRNLIHNISKVSKPNARIELDLISQRCRLDTRANPLKYVAWYNFSLATSTELEISRREGFYLDYLTPNSRSVSEPGQLTDPNIACVVTRADSFGQLTKQFNKDQIEWFQPIKLSGAKGKSKLKLVFFKLTSVSD